VALLTAKLGAEERDSTMLAGAPMSMEAARELMAALRLALRSPLTPPVGMLRGEAPEGLLAEE
jgi:hypothetical protein